MTIFQIDTRRRKGAFRFDRAAVSAPERDFRTNCFRFEVHQGAHRTEPFHWHAKVPDQNVEVVTALRQDHRVGKRLVAPVAAYETVGHVPVGHVFSVFYRDDLAQHTGNNDLVEAPPERSVAQHMADLQRAARTFGGLHKLHTARKRVSHRFFQQHVVAAFHGGDGRRHVHLILRCHDGGLGQLLFGK